MRKSKKSIMTALLLICLLAMLPLQAFAAKKSISLSASELKITVGKSKTLTATVTGPSKKVTWKSTKTGVATVDENGKITAKKAGKTKITARANGKSATCTVTVEKANYKELYRKFLEKDEVKAGNTTIEPGWFRIVNIDRKDVPELVIVDEDFLSPFCEYHVYTVKSGKVKYLGCASLKGMGTKPVIWYNKKYKGIYVGGWVNGVGGAWEGVYSISGSKLKMTRYAYEGYVWGTEKKEYKIGAKQTKVSKTKYKAYCKKNKYMAKYNTLEMYANTAVNREQYI